MTMDEFIARQIRLVGEAEFEEGRLSQTRTLRGGRMRKSTKAAEPKPPRRAWSLRTTISEKVSDLTVRTNDALSASSQVLMWPVQACGGFFSTPVPRPLRRRHRRRRLRPCLRRSPRRSWRPRHHLPHGDARLRREDGDQNDGRWRRAAGVRSRERFQKLVKEWIEKGLVREWRGLIGELEAGGHFRPIPFST